MKIAIPVIFVFLIGSYAFPQGQWILQQTPVTSQLTRLVFVDTLNGWAAGDSGKIIHTSNGGSDWTDQTIHIDYPIDDIFFLNASTGWALANDYILGTYIFTTTDAGNNWSFIRFPDNSHFYSSVFFNNINTGFLAGNEGRILKTSDSGNNWSQCSVDSSLYFQYPVRKITFFNERIGTATGGAFDLQGVVWQTTNAGLNWKSYGVAPEPVLNVCYLDSLNIIGVGGDHEFGASRIISTNSGSIWNYSLLNFFGTGYGIDFRTGQEFWIALGFSQTFAVSTNGGINWSEKISPDSASVYDIVFKTSTAGWCCGDKGRVYKFNADYVGINNISNIMPKGFSLSQNYPNPFNPSTKIRFEITSSENIKLTVYDILGKEVRTLAHQKLSPGVYEVTFNAEELNSGMYFYSLRTDSFSETKKMILLK